MVPRGAGRHLLGGPQPLLRRRERTLPAPWPAPPSLASTATSRPNSG
ncbi:hypothetical protein SXIM_51480 [Streptomyces xiamenensis]|uniref:Uncharacterized protein n=1 Tax=Streptomyces xiamenensis TaxID=408015 RepID=A0A0F7G1Z4_9ACTN|nr:hypothetical protein SXIM_51480 [Streptomyces xiamenensis]